MNISAYFPNTESTNSNAMQSTSYPYNFSDFSNADMTMQGEMKPSIHMDIPAGEKRKNVQIPDLVCVNSSLSFIARRNLLPRFFHRRPASVAAEIFRPPVKMRKKG